jgi:hypothetical protein
MLHGPFLRRLFLRHVVLSRGLHRVGEIDLWLRRPCVSHTWRNVVRPRWGGWRFSLLGKGSRPEVRAKPALPSRRSSLPGLGWWRGSSNGADIARMGWRSRSFSGLG